MVFSRRKPCAGALPPVAGGGRHSLTVRRCVPCACRHDLEAGDDAPNMLNAGECSARSRGGWRCAESLSSECRLFVVPPHLAAAAQ